MHNVCRCFSQLGQSKELICLELAVKEIMNTFLFMPNQLSWLLKLPAGISGSLISLLCDAMVPHSLHFPSLLGHCSCCLGSHLSLWLVGTHAWTYIHRCTVQQMKYTHIWWNSFKRRGYFFPQLFNIVTAVRFKIHPFLSSLWERGLLALLIILKADWDSILYDYLKTYSNLAPDSASSGEFM